MRHTMEGVSLNDEASNPLLENGPAATNARSLADAALLTSVYLSRMVSLTPIPAHLV